jgi:hypothetical protein
LNVRDACLNDGREMTFFEVEEIYVALLLNQKQYHKVAFIAESNLKSSVYLHFL